MTPRAEAPEETAGTAHQHLLRSRRVRYDDGFGHEMFHYLLS